MSKTGEQTHEDFDVDRMTLTEPIGRALTTRSHFCEGETTAAGFQGPLIPNPALLTAKDASASCVGTLA